MEQDLHTPLQLLRLRATMAARNGDVEAFEQIVTDPNFTLPLHGSMDVAARHRHLKLMEWLVPRVEHTADSWKYCMHWVMYAKDESIMTYMLNNWPACADHDELLVHAAKDDNPWAIARLMEYCSQETIDEATCMAAEKNRIHAIEILYDRCTEESLRTAHTMFPQCVYLAQRLQAQDSQMELTQLLDEQVVDTPKPKKM